MDIEAGDLLIAKHDCQWAREGDIILVVQVIDEWIYYNDLDLGQPHQWNNVTPADQILATYKKLS